MEAMNIYIYMMEVKQIFLIRVIKFQFYESSEFSEFKECISLQKRGKKFIITWPYTK